MRNIALILVALIALIGFATAMPDNEWATNPDVCKIAFDTGQSLIGIFAWQDPDTNKWEVVLGLTTYKGADVVPITFTGDALGNVLVDFS